MGYFIDTTRTDYYNELSEDERQKWLSVKKHKFLPTLDNIYYGVTVQGDTPDGGLFNELLSKLERAKQEAIVAHASQDFGHGLQVTLKSYGAYRYCLTQPDMYDIFIMGTIPNAVTPRIVVQIRAFGLWTRGEDAMLRESYQSVLNIISPFEVRHCRENRIDYCYHTNEISSPDRLFYETRRDRVNETPNMHTNLNKWQAFGRTKHTKTGTILHRDYVCFGDKKSNNVRARVYDKVREVIENGYKGFFFELWRNNGLISDFDQYCFEYALTKKNVDYINRARLMYYVEHGSNDRVRKEFDLTLQDKNATHEQMKQLADSYMPKTTAVLNIEYETKRKFYCYSDRFIEAFKHQPRLIPKPLIRLFQITDNRGLFLDYLTSKTLSFHYPEVKGKPIRYLPFWERLRNTKLGGIKTDEKLLRDYAHAMDARVIRIRTINSVASAAVYNDKVDSGFVEDLADFICHLNDNDARRLDVSLVTKYGTVLENIDSELLKEYSTTKAKKDMLLKNRKKREEEVPEVNEAKKPNED